ncbi:helix-turn-helix transcriptional regulator [Streptomyces colonosanans]|uniref:Helix-turn-helix transcriptional regulator n=1 Tax=Streptomyces colonosanans TaxID=1428652 RepID=A0A1S2NWB7_9ACTN|nr:helix-turn-helix transcriptional regulator [Streptomyces colonosanans]
MTPARDFSFTPDTPPTRGDPQAIPSLTPRERQVLVLLGYAADNREISHRLGIAERTVKAHLTNLMTKIKVTTRTEAALYAYAHHRRIAGPAA